jgi:hypothetical protein
MDADRAACQILDAVRNRRPELTITFAARLAAIVQALLPNLMADLMKLAARLLPRMPIQIKPLQLQGHSDPIADVREVASMEGRDSGMWMDQLNGSIDPGDTAFMADRGRKAKARCKTSTLRNACLLFGIGLCGSQGSDRFQPLS